MINENGKDFQGWSDGWGHTFRNNGSGSQSGKRGKIRHHCTAISVKTVFEISLGREKLEIEWHEWESAGRTA